MLTNEKVLGRSSLAGKHPSGEKSLIGSMSSELSGIAMKVKGEIQKRCGKEVSKLTHYEEVDERSVTGQIVMKMCTSSGRSNKMGRKLYRITYFCDPVLESTSILQTKDGEYM